MKLSQLIQSYYDRTHSTGTGPTLDHDVPLSQPSWTVKRLETLLKADPHKNVNNSGHVILFLTDFYLYETYSELWYNDDK